MVSERDYRPPIEKEQRNSKAVPVSTALNIDYVQCRAAEFLCEKRSRPRGRPWIEPPAQS